MQNRGLEKFKQKYFREKSILGMKNQICGAILLTMFLFSCNRDAKHTALQSRAVNKNNEQCFIAVYQKDTAILKLKTMPNGKIQGKLVISYSTLKPNALKRGFYHGEVVGQFKKDTLFADYIFIDGDIKVFYRNPIALLKKGSKLILGFGAIETYLGRSFFFNNQAINFKRCRFQFEPIECKVVPKIRPMN